MDGLDSAASAFATDIDGGAAPREQRSAPTEAMFGNLGVLDEDSPEAGGDRIADPKPKSRRAPAQEETLELEEGAEEEVLAAGEEEEGAEEGEEEGQEDEEGKGADDEDDDVYEVTVDGQRVEVPLREALDGYIRQETFHRRLESLNSYKNELASYTNKVIEQRTKYVERLTKAEELINALIPAEPNWAEEYKRDPDGAAILQKNYNDLKGVIEHIGKQKAEVSEEEQRENQDAQREYLTRENARILSNHPHWKDEKVRTRDLSAMADTAMKAGFTQEEVLGTVDSRMISLLYKAMKYDRLQANKPQPVIRKGNKPVTPGAGSKRTAPKALKSASQQLRKTGSVEDAASVMANLITPSRR